MKLWFTAQDIVDAGLPGLPQTKRGMNAYIRANKWHEYEALVRCEKGLGGTIYSYFIEQLPHLARLTYIGQSIDQQSVERHCQFATLDHDDMTPRARDEHDARLVVVRLSNQFRDENSLSQQAADHLFCNSFNAGFVTVPDWVHGAVKNMSCRSLQRWRLAEHKGDFTGFDRASARKGKGLLDLAENGIIKTKIIALIAHNPVYSAQHIRNAIENEFGVEIDIHSTATGELKTISLPPLRTFQNAIKGWKKLYENELMRMTDPDGYRNKKRFVATGTTRADRLNELWEIDASPADIMCIDGRYNLYVAIDVYSRRMKVLVTKTPRAEAVALLVRLCILDWGVPERIKTDNGSDFKARAIERLFFALGIEHEVCPPYSPEKKGIVERGIGTLQRGLSRVLPGFIGHNVAERRVIEARKAFSERLKLDDKHLFNVELTSAELQDYVHDWANLIYANNPHESLKKQTPAEFARGFEGMVQQIEDEAALAILLAPVAGKDGIRTVTKHGIRVDGEFYHFGFAMPGTVVFCRHDPNDLGRLFVFKTDGETFLGIAKCPILLGLNPAETLMQARAMQTAHDNEMITPIRAAMRKIKPRDVANAQFDVARKNHGSIVAFPHQKTSYTTPALEAAGDAANEANHHKSSQADKEVAAKLTELRNSKIDINIQSLPETRAQRYRRVVLLEKRLEAGEVIETRDAHWLGGYQQTAEYRGLKIFYEESDETVAR